MLKKSFLFAFLFAIAALVLVEAASSQQHQQLPSNKELASRAHSVYVDTDSFWMKRESLESSLLGKPEFKAWDMQIVGKRQYADLVIHVKRNPFTNHFLYTVTDTETNTIVLAGKVDSLAGTVYGQIAGEICDKMKKFRGDPLAKPATPTAQQAAAS